MAQIRLQKFLADAGIASRRKCEEFILKGLVKVNGEIITKLGTKVEPEKDKVEFQRKEIILKKRFVYLMLNKPEGYVTSMAQSGKKTIKDLIKLKERVFPAGRLDKDSTGLLILTNDGELTYKLTHPKFEHEKEYEVELNNNLTPQKIMHLEQGIFIDDEKTWPAKVKQLSPNKFTITLHEGRNRQVRNMCAALGLKVKSLKRIRIGQLLLGNLKEGKYRLLTNEEIEKLKRAT